MHRDGRYGLCRSLSPPFAKQTDYRGCGARCQVSNGTITVLSIYLNLVVDLFQIKSYRFCRSAPNAFLGLTTMMRFALTERPKLKSQTPKCVPPKSNEQ